MKPLKLLPIILFWVAILVINFSTSAQGFKKEKRIYLFDLTASMKGFKGLTPDIFEDVKKNFAIAIDKLDNDDTDIVLITFTDRVINKYSFKAHEKQKIKQTISDLKIANGNTDITAAWSAGSKELDPARVNYMFLLTDGLQTVGGNAAEQGLYNSIRNWKSNASGNDYYAFYVMLTKHATSDALVKTFKESNNVWPIESMDVDFKFIQPARQVYYNTKDDQEKKIPVLVKRKLPPNFTFNLSIANNPYYRLKQNSFNITNGAITIAIEAKDDLANIPDEYQLELMISKDNSKFWDVFFTPERIGLKMINKKEKVLTIYQK
ncbi:VWA domain-containing protein [Pontibacter sp. BAB1700]|uniref:VWA domain-containing protein n=1 Tax=Pontibacter sp. BAB1700 TaxID=1144253 RepID=UPI00026BD291|nr:VWA domain-containing protein [Pontibacter sp. BAB1700]EJF08503.1 hypothetical protein O71_20397 [Pontibacter sp. BAB1700]